VQAATPAAARVLSGLPAALGVLDEPSFLTLQTRLLRRPLATAAALARAVAEASTVADIGTGRGGAYGMTFGTAVAEIAKLPPDTAAAAVDAALALAGGCSSSGGAAVGGPGPLYLADGLYAPYSYSARPPAAAAAPAGTALEPPLPAAWVAFLRGAAECLVARGGALVAAQGRLRSVGLAGRVDDEEEEGERGQGEAGRGDDDQARWLLGPLAPAPAPAPALGAEEGEGEALWEGSDGDGGGWLGGADRVLASLLAAELAAAHAAAACRTVARNARSVNAVLASTSSGTGSRLGAYGSGVDSPGQIGGGGATGVAAGLIPLRRTDDLLVADDALSERARANDHAMRIAMYAAASNTNSNSNTSTSSGDGADGAEGEAEGASWVAAAALPLMCVDACDLAQVTTPLPLALSLALSLT